MSFLARMLAARDNEVRGSDRTRTRITDALGRDGISVSIGDGEQVADCGLVIYTGGVGETHPQLKEARACGIPTMERAEALGLLAREYAPVVAVAGTHGKTTTAAMLGAAVAQLDPTVHFGGEGSRLGGALLVTEACEYRNSFLTLRPDVAIVLNIECDHPDFYKSERELDESFLHFMRNVRKDGVVIAASDRAERLARDSGRTCVRVGAEGDWRAENEGEYDGCYAFDVVRQGAALGRCSLRVAGAHQIGNALASFAAAEICGADFGIACRGIEAFSGVPRRWERVGTVNGAPLVADYAHHPTQIAACIETARCIARGRVIVAFQPHTYTRTRTLYKEFVRSLCLADEIFLLDIYAARERDRLVTSRDLCMTIGSHRPCLYCSRDGLAGGIRDSVTGDDVVLLLGAGDIYDLAATICDSD